MIYLTRKSFAEKNISDLNFKKKFALVGVGFCETIPLALSLIAYFGIFGKLSPTANKAILGSVAGASVLLLLVEGCLLKCKNLDPEKKEELQLGEVQEIQNFETRSIEVGNLGVKKNYHQLYYAASPVIVDDSGTGLLLDETRTLYMYRLGRSSPPPGFNEMTAVCLHEVNSSYSLYFKDGKFRIIADKLYMIYLNAEGHAMRRLL